MFQASDPGDKPSEKTQDKPLHSSRPHFSWSENGKTFNKKTQKEKKKYRRQEQAWKDFIPATGVSASSALSGACKNLIRITCFNCNKKGHYTTKSPKSRKDKDISED